MGDALAGGNTGHPHKPAANPRGSARLVSLGHRISYLFILIASLTSPLYCQSPNSPSSIKSNVLGGNFFHWNLAQTVKMGATAASFKAPPTLRSSPIVDNPNYWRFLAIVPRAPVPAQNPLLAGISNWPFLGGVSLFPQQELDRPAVQKDKKQQSSTSNSPGHIFWVIPAFKVDYGKGFQPLTPKEKFKEWAQGAYDPLGLAAGAVEAGTLEYSATDGFCGYGKGSAGYGECFGSLELDALDSSFIGDFVLPVVLHQDPRYFRLGQGSFGSRVEYAVSRVFVTYNDSGHTVFFTSALSGTVIAAGLSNLYYPAQDRTVGHTMTRIAIDLGNTALYNLAAEFWPDFQRKLHHIF
jgi:hypothetical protein